MCACVEEEKKVWKFSDIVALLDKIEGKRLALEKWSQRYEALKREVRDLTEIIGVYERALAESEGESVRVGHVEWLRRDLEREVDKLKVILRGKEKALKDWERRVQRIRADLEELEKTREKVMKGRIFIGGEEVKCDGKNEERDNQG